MKAISLQILNKSGKPQIISVFYWDLEFRKDEPKRGW